MERVTIYETRVTRFQNENMDLQAEIAQLCDDMRKLAAQMANAVYVSSESCVRALSHKT